VVTKMLNSRIANLIFKFKIMKW